ncbi:MAG: class I SAM-dependent methyltransferase [Oscillospiraceae bacterium]|nr:class I SAM-dependent methyltransferase [Oscillospiraceae bacterium]
MVQDRESVTAKLCAFGRALHSNTARDKVFDDHLAFDLMGKEEYDWIKSYIQDDLGAEDAEYFLEKYFLPIVLSRTHFTEKRLEKFAVGRRVQYVICGAGADTFSFRNDNPYIEIFEIDHPDTQRCKLERIRELEWNIPHNVHFVPVDLEREKMTVKLLESGFDPDVSTFFSILGVTYYLALPTFAETLRQIAELSAIGSTLAFDYPQKENFYGRIAELADITETMGEKMRGGYDYGEVSRALYSLGFQIDEFFTPRKIQEKYFNGRKTNMKAFENVNLLSAVYTGGLSFE